MAKKWHDLLEKTRRLRRIAELCTLGKPLWMVIPPEGIVIHCPVHPDGHFVRGSDITWTHDERIR